MFRERPGRWLLFFVLLALALRVGYVFTLDPEIFWYDGQEYMRLAQGLLDHGSYLAADGSATAYWPPGYPLFLAMLGGKLLAVRLAQALLGALTVLLAYGIAREMLGRRAALFAAGVTAVYPLYIYTAGSVYAVGLKAFLIGGIFWLLLRSRERGGFLMPLVAGLLGAWLVLCSASLLPALLLGALWLLLEKRERPFVRRAGMALLFILPLVLILGSWSIRNHREMGRAAPVSMNGGYNFWLGNYPGVKATTGNRWTEAMQNEFHNMAEVSEGEAALDRALYARGLEYVKAEPGRFIGLSFFKALNLWRLWPQPMTEDRPGLSLEKLISLFSYGIILPFALVFLFATLRRHPASRLALLFFLATTLVHAVTLSKFRFRLPLDVIVIVLGVGGLGGVMRMMGKRWLE